MCVGLSAAWGCSDQHFSIKSPSLASGWHRQENAQKLVLCQTMPGLTKNSRNIRMLAQAANGLADHSCLCVSPAVQARIKRHRKGPAWK